MKKILAFFLVFALVGAVFADEPSAEAKVAEFTGDAAVTFGVNLDNYGTGFKNEVGGKIKLNLLKGGDKSTTGDGVWGELKITVKDFNVQAKADKPVELLKKSDDDDIKVEIDTAKIHIGPAYVGIKSGDFNYGGGFWYPNALNYKDDNDKDFNRNPAAKLEYNQGLVLGYEQKDLFKVEASVRTKKDTGKKLDKVEGVILPKDTEIKKGEYFKTSEGAHDNVDTDDVFADAALTDPIPGKTDVKKLKNTKTVFKRVMKDGDTDYWTNKYAFGIYGEVTPITGLKVGVGTAYALGKVTTDTPLYKATIQDKDNRGDINFFTGAEYKLPLGEKYVVQPVVTYTLYADAQWNKTDEKLFYPEQLKTNMLNAGVRFGWGEEKKSNSLLYDFFGKNTLVYDTNKDDKGDKKLLPGVSLFASFDLRKDAMKAKIPLMLTFYSGEFVKNLNVAALTYVNAAEDAWKTVKEKEYDLQIGLAASYDVKLNDITIVPAAALLWENDTGKVLNNPAHRDVVRAEAKVDVKGFVQNTTFSLFWDGAKFETITVNSKVDSYKLKNGELGLKAKIAL